MGDPVNGVGDLLRVREEFEGGSIPRLGPWFSMSGEQKVGGGIEGARGVGHILAGAGAGASPTQSCCRFFGTINVYFTSIPLTNPTTFLYRRAENEDSKRGMEIGVHP